MSTAYDLNFYKAVHETAESSATQVIPTVIDIVNPTTVIDVGCGSGTWLSVLKQNGVSQVLGVDVGYVDRQFMLIADDEFQRVDLAKPFELTGEFDLRCV